MLTVWLGRSTFHKQGQLQTFSITGLEGGGPSVCIRVFPLWPLQPSHECQLPRKVCQNLPKNSKPYLTPFPSRGLFELSSASGFAGFIGSAANTVKAFSDKCNPINLSLWTSVLLGIMKLHSPRTPRKGQKLSIFFWQNQGWNLIYLFIYSASSVTEQAKTSKPKL